MKQMIVIAAAAALLAGTALPETSALADTTVYSNNFESGSTSGFTGGSIEQVPNGSTHILGEFAQGGATTLSLTGLAAHNSATLSFTLDVVGSMDGNGQEGSGGDNFVITAGGTAIFDQNFANYGGSNTQNFPINPSAPATGNDGVNTLGYSGFPDSGNNVQDTIYQFDLPFSTSASNLDITFAGDTSEPTSNEFYGIDNVAVTIGSVATPEPAGLAVLASALFGLGLVRRRRPRAS